MEQWIDNLWGNLLGTKDSSYFWRIVELFENNDKIGLLGPPEPMGESFSYDNGWGGLYVLLVKELADDLDLHVDIDMDINHQPITLGTCFWARKPANKSQVLFSRFLKLFVNLFLCTIRRPALYPAYTKS